MRKSIALGAFAALAAGSAGVGALDSVPAMVGSDTLKNLTVAVIDACTDLGTYTADNDPLKAGKQPIVYNGTGSGNGENAMKPSPSTQWVAPMSKPMGTGICNAAAPRAGAEGIIMALDAVSIAVAGSVVGAEGIDYPGAAGDPANNWKTVLREVYTGMGATGSNLYARDCNSASRHAIVDNWDNIFHGSTGTTCADSNPDSGAANVEPGLRHAFRRDEESGTTDVFLGQLGLPTVNFQQTAPSSGSVPTGSTTTQAVIYRALANSPFCNIRRPEDKNLPVNKGGSFIPPMYQVGVPASIGGPATGNQGLVPYDPSLGDNARFMAPYMTEMQDEDPIRRKCFGPKVTVLDSPTAPREEVCSADGQLGLVLPINPPPALTTSERYPVLPCEDTRDFEFGPAPTRPTGDPVRCPNGDAPQDGKCLLPTRTAGAGFAFDCLNNGLNSPAAIFDADGNGSDYPDAPTTDGRGDADGRAYNLILRAADGSVRTIARPNPVALGTMNLPVVGAFYRIHSSRSGLPAPASTTQVCATQDDATDQIGCLAQKSLCSIGYAGGGAITNNPGTVAALVNGVQATPATVQALVAGGTAYPLSRKLYLNSLRGFENLLTSSDPSGDAGKDAELDLAECYANLPFSTFASVGTSQINIASPAFGFVPLPGATPKALCEDFNGTACTDATNTDACENNTGLIPTSACNNGLKDGDETGPDACPAARPTCSPTTHHCI
jgi:hypothetical protein